MTLAAVIPTLRPSIWLASWAARSSQRSARAGEAADKVNTSAISAKAKLRKRTPESENAIKLVMNTPAPLKRGDKIHASLPKSSLPQSSLALRLSALAFMGQRNPGRPACAIVEKG